MLNLRFRKRAIKNAEIVDGATEVVVILLARGIVPKVTEIDVIFGILAPIGVCHRGGLFFALQSAVDKQFDFASIETACDVNPLADREFLVRV